jgi:ubiquinone/menaquinone biosynthesis C-methylase UbiE
MKTLKELKTAADAYFERCENLVNSYPWAVAISMHEYMRNLYPDDPHIPFKSYKSPTERIFHTANALSLFLDTVSDTLGHYDQIIEMGYWQRAKGGHSGLEVKETTGQVYGEFWKRFSLKELTDISLEIVKERFKKNDVDTDVFSGKAALDIGCGSGRFSYALKRLGCSSVVGVDYGDRGLEVANKFLEQTGETNIQFRKCDVLDLPFDDESFEVVFCHGVLHHTENLEKGVSEMLRVAQKGAFIWFYIYGSGGIFWHSRERMPEIMKKIPQEYTQAVMDIVGQPPFRFIFQDNWYVPIEQHTTNAKAQELLQKYGATSIRRKVHGRSTDTDYLVLEGGEEERIMWGDGDLMYFIEK